MSEIISNVHVSVQLTKLTTKENAQGIDNQGFSRNGSSFNIRATGGFMGTDQEKMKRSYIGTLIGLSVVQFSSFVSMFVLSAFFLDVCQKRNISGLQGGAIIGMLQAVFIFMSYLFLGDAHRFPMKRQMMAGLAVTGICLITFAFLDRIESNVWFIVVCLIVRAIQGMAIAVSDVCALIVANKASPPEAFSTVIGFMELSVQVGLSVAPPLGGYLFQVGGYFTPFLVSAAMLFLSAIFCIPTISPVQVEKKFVSEMIKDTFGIKLYCAIFLICGGFLGFLNGMIEPHLRQYDLSPVLVGVVILVTNVFSGITFPIWGHICDSVLKPPTVTFICCAVGGLGFILFGPFPYIPIPSKLWIVVVSLALSGAAISGVIISSYGQARTSLGVLCRNEENADTVMSAAYIAFCNFGFFVGAILGGLFIDSIGFSNGSAILFGFQMLVALIQIAILCIRK